MFSVSDSSATKTRRYLSRSLGFAGAPSRILSRHQALSALSVLDLDLGSRTTRQPSRHLDLLSLLSISSICSRSPWFALDLTGLLSISIFRFPISLCRQWLSTFLCTIGLTSVAHDSLSTALGPRLGSLTPLPTYLSRLFSQLTAFCVGIFSCFVGIRQLTAFCYYWQLGNTLTSTILTASCYLFVTVAIFISYASNKLKPWSLLS